MRQIVAACWTAKREEGAGAGGGRRDGGTEREGEVARGSRKRKERGWPRRVISRRNGRLERLVSPRSGGYFRESYCYWWNRGERNLLSACRFFFFSSLFLFLFHSSSICHVLYTDNWWNGSIHFFFSSQKFIRSGEFSSLSLKYIFKVGVVILYNL